MQPKADKIELPAKPKGEVWVWFTSMGLAVGLSMVVLLFGLILVRGLTYFWPVPIMQIELREDSLSSFRGHHTFAGALAKTQQRTDRVRVESADGFEYLPDTYTEIQLFLGNRDTYGQAFRYFREDDVIARHFPKDIIRAERRTEGDGIFFPVKLSFQDGRELSREEPGFEQALQQAVAEARQRRAQIQRIDRRQIGAINLEMNNIDIRLRYFQRKGDLSDAEVIAVEQLRERQQELRERYLVLEAEADALRALNQATVLHFARADTTTGTLPVGDLYRYHYPNRMNLAARLWQFCVRFWDFVSTYPRDANMDGGIFPAIFGTFVMTLIMSIAVTPFGVIAAVYLREYARQGPLVRSVRIAVNNLAGVPSIVYGVFGLGFFVYFVGGAVDNIFFPLSTEMNVPTFGTGGIMWAGFTLALLNLPVVIVATEESIAAVSRGVREGSLACGASKWQTMQRLVLPASLPGILTGMILAMARGAGEVAPLMLVGVVALAPNLPVDGNFPFVHLERKFMHLGFHIYDVGFQSPDSEAAIPAVFATTLVLIGLIVLLNMTAILLRNHVRKKHKASAF